MVAMVDGVGCGGGGTGEGVVECILMHRLNATDFRQLFGWNRFKVGDCVDSFGQHIMVSLRVVSDSWKVADVVVVMETVR